MTALQGLLRKEFFHIRRDRRTAAVLIALPVVQVMLFGYAIRTDVDDVRLAVVDPAPDSATIALRNRFAAGGVFRTVAVVPRTADLDTLFESGKAQQAIVFYPGFARDLGSGVPAKLLILTDATEPNTGSLLQSYAESVVNQWAGEAGRASGAGRAGGAGESGRAGPFGPARAIRIVPQSRMRFNPTRESSNLFVPGLMAFVLTIISSLMTAISLTREKETGTMEALLVSPLRPWEIIAGKVTPYLAIGFISVVAVLVEALLVFHVPLRGSVPLLLFEGALYILVSLSLGILISARTSSQRVAMMFALLGTMLPNILLSGFIFPLESMPAALRAISYVIPGRWFVAIARGIMLKGIGLEYVWRETLFLAAMAAVLLVASIRSFNERLE
ncbi:MAG TPA: ABC transporter permease [Vicinamibacterales bacterium]|nr:ABC transporter permease [Vicinamibacterales bacterium]